MKVCVVQTRPVSGDIEKNIAAHIKWIHRAVQHGASLVIFPELSLTGYEPLLAATLATTPQDHRLAVFRQLADSGGATIGVGLPVLHGAGVQIGMVLFRPGAETVVYAKKHLHADETPYFVAGRNTEPLVFGGHRIALAICFEITVAEHAASALEQGATLYVASVAKSVLGAEQAATRLASVARTGSIAVLMANCTGLCDGVECGGGTSAWDPAGLLVAQLNGRDEGMLLYDTVSQSAVIRYGP